jgi:Reverse transcriptase (RNA-dependent DNA polymerase)
VSELFGPQSGTDKVLHLLKSLYSLCHAPRTFFRKLKASLEEHQWEQSEIDPCLFLKTGMMFVVYVDDTVFASSIIDDLEQEITSLGINSSVQRHTFTLQNEGEVCAFLGVHIKKLSHNKFILTQSGLIDKVLSVTGMADCNGCGTLASPEPLHTDSDGSPFWKNGDMQLLLVCLCTLLETLVPILSLQSTKLPTSPIVPVSPILQE